ncbi:hypothetical protein HZS_1686, partial [Henneguya salminicola]
MASMSCNQVITKLLSFTKEKYPSSSFITTAEKVITNHFHMDNFHLYFDNILDMIYKNLNKSKKININLGKDSTTQEADHDELTRIIELISLVPNSLVTAPQISRILKYLLRDIKNETEKNALMSIKLAVNYVKSHRPHYKDEVLIAPLFQVSKFVKTLPSFYHDIDRKDSKFILGQVNELGFVEDDLNKAHGDCLFFQDVVDSYSLCFADTNFDKRSSLSLKVMAEIHVFLVLVFQLYRQNIVNEIELLIPYMVEVLNLQPLLSCRRSSNFNRDLHIDLVNLQLKILSLIIYLKRSSKQDSLEMVALTANKDRIIKGLLGILRYFPQDIPHIKNELILYTRHLVPSEKDGFVKRYYELIIRSLTETADHFPSTDALQSQVCTLLCDLMCLNQETITVPNTHACFTYTTDLIFSKNLSNSALRTCIKMATSMLEVVKNCNLKRQLIFQLLRAFDNKIMRTSLQLEHLYSKYQNSLNNKYIKTHQSLTQKIESSFLKSKDAARIVIVSTKLLISSVNTCAMPSFCIISHMSSSEAIVFRRYFRHGINLLNYFRDPFISESRIQNKEMKHLIDKLEDSSCLQNIPNNFLANQNTSSIFCYVYLKFFIDNFLEFNGFIINILIVGERSTLHFRFFKMVLGSTVVFHENEVIIKSWVSFIINHSLKQMLNAGQSLNYLFILRALFRSIGNSTMDSMYQEFLPHLKNILTVAFNRYRTSLNYGVILEVIIEISLSLPARLSNLVPHIPLILYPLVTSLLTSTALNSQGHRTLELCLDSIHSLFVNNVVDDIRNDILATLCRRTSQNAEFNNYSLKLIGKMSGAALKPYQFYQKLQFYKNVPSCSVNLNHNGSSIPLPIPIYDILDSCVKLLREVTGISTSSTPNDPAKEVLIKYSLDAWEVIKTYICAIIPPQDITSYLPYLLRELSDCNINETDEGDSNKSCLKIAFLGLLYMNYISKFQHDCLCLIIYCVRVFTLFTLLPRKYFDISLVIDNELKQSKGHYLYPCDFISSIFIFLTSMNVEIQNFSGLMVSIIVKTTYKYLEDTHIKFVDTKVYQKLMSNCIKYSNDFHYEMKHASILVLRQMLLSMKIFEVKPRLDEYLTILFDIIASLYSEISSDSLDYSANSIIFLLEHCYTNDRKANKYEPHQIKIVILLTKQLHGYSDIGRDIAKKGLKFLADTWKVTLKELISLNNQYIQKRLLKNSVSGFNTLPFTIQLADLDAIVFYASIEPPYLDWNTTIEQYDAIINTALTYSESDKSYFHTISSTKDIMDIPHIRLSAFRMINTNSYLGVMDTFKNVPNLYPRVVSAACKAIINSDGAVLDAAKNILLSIIRSRSDESFTDTISAVIRPLLVKLAQFQQFTMVAAKQMRCLVEAFPGMFNEKLCDQFISTLRESLSDLILRINKSDPSVRPLTYSVNGELTLWSIIIDIFHVMPNATPRFIQPLILLINEMKNNFGVREFDSLFCSLLKFLNKYPVEACDFFLKSLNDESISFIFIHLLKVNTIPNNLRSALLKNPLSIFPHIFPNLDLNSATLKLDQLDPTKTITGLRLIWAIQNRHNQFLSVFPLILTTIRKIWQYVAKNTLPVDIHNEKICILICKNVYSHILYSFDDSLFLEFINSLIISHICNWLKQDIFSKIITKLSVKETLKFTYESISFFLSSNTNSEQRRDLIDFLSNLFEEKFRNEDSRDELDLNFKTLLQLYEKIIVSNHPIQYDASLTGALLHFSCVFVEWIPEIFHEYLNKLDKMQLESLLNYIQPSLRLRRFFDPYCKCNSFLLISLIADKYDIIGADVEKYFIEVLRAYQYDHKTIIKSAVAHFITALGRDHKGIRLIGSLTQKVIIEDNNIALATCHILSIINDHQDVYNESQDILFLPIINSLTRLNISLYNPHEEKTIFFETAMMILEWQVNVSSSENDFNNASKYANHLSILYSYILKNYIILNENSFAMIQHSDAQVFRACHFIKHAIKIFLFKNVKLNFGFFDSPNLQTSSTPSTYNSTGTCTGFKDKSVTQLYYSSILYSIELLSHIINDVQDDSAVGYIINYFTRDISKLANYTSISVEIRHAAIVLIGVVFNRFKDPLSDNFKPVEGLYNFSINWISETLSLAMNILAKSDHALSFTLFCKLMPGLKIHIIEKFIPSISSLLTNFNSIINDKKMSVDQIEILNHLLHVVSYAFSSCSLSLQEEFFCIFSSIASNLTDLTIAQSLVEALNHCLDHLYSSNFEFNECYLTHFCEFLYQTVYIITLHHCCEFTLNLDLFKKIMPLFKAKHIFSDSCLPHIQAIYNAGIYNQFSEVRDLFLLDKKKLFNSTILEKFCLFLTKIDTSPMICYHSHIKYMIELLISSTDNKNRLQLSSLYSSLPPLHDITAAKQPELSNRSQTIFEFNQVYSCLFSEIKKDFDMKESSESSLDEVYYNINFGYDVFESFNISSEYFFKNVINIMYFDGQAADLLFKRLFTLFWSKINLDHRNILITELETYLINTTTICFNDSSFINDIQEMSPANLINYDKLTQSLPGFYKCFLAPNIELDSLSSQRYTSLCKISCLPQSTLNTLMCSIIIAKPIITIFPSVVSYIAKRHSCLAECALYLENYENVVEPFKNHEIGASVPYDLERYETPLSLHNLEIFLSLESIYSQLCEEDYTIGIWSINALFGTTVTALGLLSHGYVLKASAQFEDSLLTFGKGLMGLSQLSNPFFPHENRLWGKSWMNCMSELGQWGRLLEFSKNKIYHESCIREDFITSAMTSSWKLLDFTSLKQMLSLINNEPGLSIDAYVVHYYKAILALFGKSSPKNQRLLEIINPHIVKGFKSIDSKMSRLPQVITSSHLPLFRFIHLFADLHEIGKYNLIRLDQTSSGAPDTLALSLTNDFMTIHKLWRAHYPDKFDKLSHWSDVTCFRAFTVAKALGYLDNINPKSIVNKDITLPKFILDNFPSQSFEPHSQKALSQIFNDNLMLHWIKFTAIARQQDNFIASLNSIESARTSVNAQQYIYNNSFRLISQEVKNYLDLYKQFHDKCYLEKGLEIINSDWAKYQLYNDALGPMSTLKARIQSRTNLFNEANTNFAEGILKYEHSSGWSGWAQMLNQIFNDKKDYNIGVSAIMAYINAAKNPVISYKAQKYLSLALWMLESDSPSGILSVTFGTYSTCIIESALIKFAQNLFDHLLRKHGENFVKILSYLGQKYPQLVFACARMHNAVEGSCQERTVELPYISYSCRSNPSSTEATPTKNSAMPSPNILALRRIKQVVHAIQLVDACSIFYLENFIESLNAFNETDFDKLYRQTKFCLKIVSSEMLNSDSFTNKPSEVILAMIEEIQNYLPALNVHRSLCSLDSDANMSEILKYIGKLWGIVSKASKKLPKYFPITKLSQFYYSLMYNDVVLELPGEYLDAKIDVSGFNGTKILKFFPTGDMVIKPAYINRRIHLLGSNGKRFSFRVIHNKSFKENLQEDCVFTIFNFSNAVFLNTKNSNRRNIYFHIPYNVMYSPTLKLIQDDVSCLTLHDIMLDHLNKINLDESNVLELLIQINLMARSDIDIIDLSELDNKANEMLPPDILMNWAFKTYNNPVFYFIFRKQFTISLALYSIFEFVLSLMPLFPDMVTIHKEFGSLMFSDLVLDVLLFDPEACLNTDNNRKVFMRLTPNIQKFITNIGIHGPFSHTMFAASNAIARSVSYWPTMAKIAFRQASTCWSSTIIEDLNEDIVPFINRLSTHCSKLFNDCGNPQTGLQKISEIINSSMNPINFLSNDIL